MTEPVAWRKKHSGDKKWRYEETGYIGNWDEIERLYTVEQLHPRVKMTQAEFDEWKELHYRHVIFTAAATAIDNDAANQEHRYDNIYNRIYNDFGNSEALRNNEAIFAKLYVEFDSKKPEATIEIVPNMKWFVRSKEKYQADPVQGLPESGHLYLTDGGGYSIEYCEMTTFKDDATQFDTKEESEKWTNPLTEAVLLPVEDR